MFSIISNCIDSSFIDIYLSLDQCFSFFVQKQRKEFTSNNIENQNNNLHLRLSDIKIRGQLIEQGHIQILFQFVNSLNQNNNNNNNNNKNIIPPSGNENGTDNIQFYYRWRRLDRRGTERDIELLPHSNVCDP